MNRWRAQLAMAFGRSTTAWSDELIDDVQSN